MNRSTVWIDHSKAYIFDYLPDGIHRREITSEQRGKGPEHLRKFYHSLAGELSSTDCLLLAGPGMAKEEFLNHCEGHHPRLARAVVEVISMKDHPSYDDILKASNAFYAKYNEWTGH